MGLFPRLRRIGSLWCVAAPLRSYLTAYGRLLLATHECLMTGGLVACDWLRPVTRVCGVCILQSALVGSVVVLLFTWAHILQFILWRALCLLVISWFCPTARLGLPVFLCRTTRYYIADYIFGTMYEEWFILFAFSNNYCMWCSNYVNRDATATPWDFMTFCLRICRNTPDYHVKLVTAWDLTSLRRRWPSYLFVEIQRRQVDMETLRRACKRDLDSEFGGALRDDFQLVPPYYIIDYHLELGQLWQWPVEWCRVWKGTAQDCMDHLRGRHNADSSVGLKTRGKYFPPWTVTRTTWHAVRPGVSGSATDVMLFHQHDCRLVHRHRIYKDPLPQVSLRGKVIRKLTLFANQDMAVARLTSLNLSIPLSGTDGIYIPSAEGYVHYCRHLLLTWKRLCLRRSGLTGWRGTSLPTAGSFPFRSPGVTC